MVKTGHINPTIFRPRHRDSYPHNSMPRPFDQAQNQAFRACSGIRYLTPAHHHHFSEKYEISKYLSTSLFHPSALLPVFPSSTLPLLILSIHPYHLLRRVCNPLPQFLRLDYLCLLSPSQDPPPDLLPARDCGFKAQPSSSVFMYLLR